MIANEMFGSDIIRVKIKGYLKNNNDKKIANFDEIGIKRGDKITFTSDGVKYTIKYNDKNFDMIREGKEFVCTFSFDKKKSECNYFMKEELFSIDIDIKVIDLKRTEKYAYVKYLVVDSNIEYEFKVEASDIYEYKK